VSEADIQTLVHAYPACLPIAEIDAMFSAPVPICTELETPAGAIDNFMVTPSGLPVLVECTLAQPRGAARGSRPKFSTTPKNSVAGLRPICNAR
jgi:hypothetical protein